LAPETKIIPSKSWMIGFIEAKGSFTINKDRKKYLLIFSVTFHERDVLDLIKYVLKIKAKVTITKPNHHYKLSTVSLKIIEDLISYFEQTFLGITALRFKIWGRSYGKSNSELEKSQLQLRKLNDTVSDSLNNEESKLK
jgi:hypothetical protein